MNTPFDGYPLASKLSVYGRALIGERKGESSMHANKWERIAAGSGIAFVALALVSSFIVPQPPSLNDPQGFAAYTVAHRTGLLTQSYLSVLAAGFLLWFVGSLRSTLRRAEGGTGRLSSVVFGAGVATASLAFAGIALSTEAAFRANTLDASTINLLGDIGAIAFTFLWIPVAVAIGATAITSYRTGILPKWHALIGGAYAIAAAAGGALIYGTRGYWSIAKPTGAGLVLFLAFAAWIATTSVLMLVGDIDTVTAATEQDDAKVHWHLRRVV